MCERIEIYSTLTRYGVIQLNIDFKKKNIHRSALKIQFGGICYNISGNANNEISIQFDLLRLHIFLKKYNLINVSALAYNVYEVEGPTQSVSPMPVIRVKIIYLIEFLNICPEKMYLSQ